MLSESCRGESPARLMLGGPFIPGRLKAAADIFFVVVGVEGDELRFGDICEIGGGDA